MEEQILLKYIDLPEIEKIRKRLKEPILSTQILTNILRINILYMIMRTGSGHIGTSFSCLDVLTWLWLQEMINPNEINKKKADLYFSSKGHDAPAFYALLLGLGKIDFKLIHKLRRLGGLPGHPDIHTPYVLTNTGSLGMGISKAKGMVISNRLRGKEGKVYVLTGDGELQEGQFWESLQPVLNSGLHEITVIIDHNKIQSDTWVEKTSSLGKLEEKLSSFGWEVARCDAHDLRALGKVFTKFKKNTKRPQILIADTIKGKGVSFMESSIFGKNEQLYKFHSGAPSYENYEKAILELEDKINSLLSQSKHPPLNFTSVNVSKRVAPTNVEKLVPAYGDELLKIGQERKDTIAMDGDLVLDTGLIPFKNKFPKRYFECGIAEQDMVSFAGGLALSGMLPIVHSFACFLSTRPNEQIYNNSTEETKIIYTGSLAGLLPGGPGHSHQCVRDISSLGDCPDLTLVEPSNEMEARMTLRWAVYENDRSTYIRLASIPCEIPYQLPKNYKLIRGRGVVLRKGKNIVLISYGPVMLSQAFKAAEVLNATVVNLPWLNFVDVKWLEKTVGGYKMIVTIDDHYTNFGQGTMIGSTIAEYFSKKPRLLKLGVEEIPACGTNDEVLSYHQLDANSLVKRIKRAL